MIKATYDVSYLVFDDEGLLSVGTQLFYGLKKNIPSFLDKLVCAKYDNPKAVVIITNITWLSFRNLTK